MPDPPDRDKMINSPQLIFDKTKKLKTTINGPIYLKMNRENQTGGLQKVSPFLIEKVVDQTCGGKVEMVKKHSKKGSILIKTKNSKQATKLIQLVSITPEINVEITEHE